jgi:hypothetical protein
LSITNASNECLIWWREKSQLVLRIVFTNLLSVSTRAEIRILDKNGKEKQSLPKPILYNESFRYFRLSQVSDDVFESFRNMYLAFELLLSSKYPKKLGERRWLDSSLRKVNKSIALSSVYKPKGADVVTEIVNEIYVGMRCRLFRQRQIKLDCVLKISKIYKLLRQDYKN